MTRDIALILLAGVVVITVGVSLTALAITGTISATAVVGTLGALVALGTAAIGRLSGVGTSTVTNNNVSPEEVP